MPPDSHIASKSPLGLFRPSLPATLILVPLVIAALGVALFLRYGIIQNTPIGLACEGGGESLTCTVRLTAILMFTWDVFGWVAVAAALIQLWRPNSVAFGISVVFAALGLVLYNTRLSALAVALLVLSLARAAPKAR
jgi:Gpi18-like mannosyltransferase